MNLDKTCSIDGCDRHVHGRGLCNKHYMRLLNGYDPAQRPRRDDPRLWPIVNGIVTVPLTLGQVGFIDEADFDLVSPFTWLALKTQQTFYASTSVPGSKTKYWAMHRMILGAPDGVLVDHRDGNGLNNTRANLRLTDHSGNARNRVKPRTNTSGYKGVSWRSQSGVFIAAIRLEGKRVVVGRSVDPAECARMYDAAAVEHYGEFAKTNVDLGLLEAE